MTDYQAIYQSHAADYERLVAREDQHGNILRAIREIQPLDGLDVVEFGAGTGRLTYLLAPFVRSLRAFDAAEAMLAVARAKQPPTLPITFEVADSRTVPIANATADLAIAGWTFGHMTDWHGPTWRSEIGAMVAEMQRVLRSGGTAIILETLGTGRATPQPPNAQLAAYYAMLEQELGFHATWIRTDYRFASRAEADELATFFFGAPMPVSEQPDGSAVLPECTGLWWKTVS